MASSSNLNLTDNSRWSDSVFAYIEHSHLRALAALFALALMAFLPGIMSLQPFDRDEPRFAQASKQMLETGDYIDIRFQEEGRHKKPVGIYWLQTAVVSAAEHLGVTEARTQIGLYRLPSLLGAIVVVLGTYWGGITLLAGLGGVAARRAAFLAGALMAAPILLGVEARLAKTDAVLSACTIIAMAILARAYLSRGQQLPLMQVITFWIAVGGGILVKGPLLLMVVGLTFTVLSMRERSTRWFIALRPLWGLLIVALITLPWFIAIWIKTGGAFFEESVGKDMLAKVRSGQERHWGPPGTYLLVFFGTFWPAAALTIFAIPAIWRERRCAWIAFCLAWIIPAWLVFEIMPTKLPHYVLPLYPAIAILTAWALLNDDNNHNRRYIRFAAILIPIVPILAAAGLSAFTYIYDGVVLYSAIPGFAIAILLSLWSCYLFWKKRSVASAWLAIISAIAFSFSVFGVAQQHIPSLKLSPRLAEATRVEDCVNPQIATTRYREPSLVFLTRTDLYLTNGEGAANFLAHGNCRVAFVEKNDEAAFEERLSQIGLASTLITRVRGFNINGGRLLDIGVYKNTWQVRSQPAQK